MICVSSESPAKKLPGQPCASPEHQDGGQEDEKVEAPNVLDASPTLRERISWSGPQPDLVMGGGRPAAGPNFPRLARFSTGRQAEGTEGGVDLAGLLPRGFGIGADSKIRVMLPDQGQVGRSDLRR